MSDYLHLQICDTCYHLKRVDQVNPFHALSRLASIKNSLNAVTKLQNSTPLRTSMEAEQR